MNPIAKVAAWVYGLQLFIVLPWFFGAFYRGEQSLWVWEQYQTDLHRHGKSDAVFLLYLYALFYSALVTLPYLAISARFDHDEHKANPSIRIIIAFVSVWVAITLLIFNKSIFEFLRHLPTDIWNGWLFIIWAALTVVVIGAWHVLNKDRRKR